MDMLIDHLIERVAVFLAVALALVGLLTRWFNLPWSPIFTRLVRWTLAVTALALAAVYWIVPVLSIVYVANADPFESYSVEADGEVYCIKSNTWRMLVWRFSVPDAISVSPATGQGGKRYAIGPGTWFLNVGAFPVETEWTSVVSDHTGRTPWIVGGHARFGGPSLTPVGKIPRDRYAQAYSYVDGEWKPMSRAPSGACAQSHTDRTK